MRLSPHPLDTPHHSSFLLSLNSIDENKSIDDFTFAKKRCASVRSNYMPEKRQSDPNPAIRFSFYNRLFDMSDNTQCLLSPEKDFRKFSLPSSMTSLHDYPISSMASSSMWNFNKANGRRTTQSRSKDPPFKFRCTVNDEVELEKRNSLFDFSPMEDFIDEQCLHFEENFVNLEDFEINFESTFFEKKFSEDFDGGVSPQSQMNTEVVMNKDTTCKKCGHDILRL